VYGKEGEYLINIIFTMREQIISHPEIVRNEHQVAVDFFNPKKFGFQLLQSNDIAVRDSDPQRGKTWIKEFPGHGTIVFSTVIVDETKQQLARLQDRQFLQQAVPNIDISTAQRRDGAVIIAYDPAKGFTEEGWYGYVMGMGGKNIFHSRVIEVNREIQENDVGFHLKMLQAHRALELGYDTIEVVFDPLRGPNAQLNIANLGGIIRDYEQNLYFSSPDNYDASDRAIVRWPLTIKQTHQRIKHAKNGGYKINERDLQGVAHVTAENIGRLLEEDHDLLLYEIPGDVSKFTKDEAAPLRSQQRQVLSALLTTYRRPTTGVMDEMVVYTDSEKSEGPYAIYDFFSTFDYNAQGRRHNYYLLGKK
jgi:predicted GNAT superfamily acetyltransferase